MLNTRYIEIDSTFRNRNEWPEPAQFELLISQTGNKDAKTALDPISTSAPIIRWIPLNIAAIAGTVLPGYNTTYNEFSLPVPIALNASKEIDYYNGCPITVGGNLTRIQSWKFLSSNGINDYFNVTISPSLSTIPTGVVTFGNVSDYFVINGVFIPNGLKEDNYYIGYYIYNENLNQTRKIISYDGTTKIAIVENPTIYLSWLPTHTLVLRETNPSEILTFPYYNNTLIQLDFNNTRYDGDYIGDFIRLQSGSSVYKIVNHIVVEPVSYEVTSTTSLRMYFNPDILSKNTNEYVGFTIIINTPRTISGWTFIGLSNNLEVFDLTTSAIFATPVLNLKFPKIMVINDSIGSYSVMTSVYEILRFTRDNFSPFNFTGGVASHQEAVCYEIKLVNLTLPNLPLKTGSRIAFLPYVYVEFQSYTSGNYNIIYSNNPKATRMIFRVAIDDISNPEIVPFIKLKSEMTQTLKFRPTDNFKFGVYLPDGSLFSTIYSENFSPLEPNPLVQISALFSIKRCQ
jgi:hypothetical protein